jgi:hypothetical protein
MHPVLFFKRRYNIRKICLIATKTIEICNVNLPIQWSIIEKAKLHHLTVIIFPIFTFLNI